MGTITCKLIPVVDVIPRRRKMSAVSYSKNIIMTLINELFSEQLGIAMTGLSIG